MRRLPTAFVALLVAWAGACGGEVGPSEQEKGTDRAPVQAETEGSAGAIGVETGTDVPATGAAQCWSYGAPADGECEVGAHAFCDGYVATTSSGASTHSFCERICVNEGGKATWSAKSYDAACPFFDSKWHVSRAGCTCADLRKRQEQSSSTPLVLAFDDRPIAFRTDAGGAFDLVADGMCHGSDWPTAATPWLALDRNGNGAIDDGSELFGSAVRLASGARAKNGFDALRELDSNRDGVFDAEDEAFSRVVVWTDRDGDRRSSPRELTTLAEAGVRAISLADHADRTCDARGNCEGERSTLTLATGRTGAVVDVYLRTR